MSDYNVRLPAEDGTFHIEHDEHGIVATIEVTATTCEECGGEGTIENYEYIDEVAVEDGSGASEEYIECPYCDGDGTQGFEVEVDVTPL